MRHKAVIDLLSDESLKELADKIAESHSEDLVQEVALVLLEMDDEKWEEKGHDFLEEEYGEPTDFLTIYHGELNVEDVTEEWTKND